MEYERRQYIDNLIKKDNGRVKIMNDKHGAWQDYYTYGGMPLVLMLDTSEERSSYLKNLFSQTYIKDISERNNIMKDTEIL